MEGSVKGKETAEEEEEWQRVPLAVDHQAISAASDHNVWNRAAPVAMVGIVLDSHCKCDDFEAQLHDWWW